jgi:hypothetical protein
MTSRRRRSSPHHCLAGFLNLIGTHLHLAHAAASTLTLSMGRLRSDSDRPDSPDWGGGGASRRHWSTVNFQQWRSSIGSPRTKKGSFVVATEFTHRAVRPAILALVAGAHLVVVLLLMPLLEKRNMDRGGAAPSKLLLISRPYLDSKPVPTRPQLTPVPVTSIAPRPAPLADEAIDTPVSQSAPPLPDWKQAGAQAAIEAVHPDDFRALGPNSVREEPKQNALRSPFAEPPRHHWGEMDEDAERNPIMWLSNNCFQRPRDLRAEPGDPFAAVPMTFCSFQLGKREARGDLFEHLRKPPRDP